MPNKLIFKISYDAILKYICAIYIYIYIYIYLCVCVCVCHGILKNEMNSKNDWNDF
jgi:hypothetical protein